MVSPDNMDTSVNSLMVQEDTDNAKIWRYDFGTTSWSVVATVNDPDGESSGIVDASQWFGSGTWLLDVQAHGVLRLRAADLPFFHFETRNVPSTWNALGISQYRNVAVTQAAAWGGVYVSST